MRWNCAMGVLLAGSALAAAMGQAVEPAAVPNVRTFDHNGAIPAGGGAPDGNGSGVGSRTYPIRAVDVTNIETNGIAGDAANTVVELFFAPGTTIWGYSANAMFSYFGGPANPNMGFRLKNSANEFIPAIFTPGAPNSNIVQPPTKVAPNDEIVLHDGRLFIEFIEVVNDAPAPDGRWTGGTIGVLFQDSGECCLWDNGLYDERTSVPSQDACTRLPPTNQVCIFVADDFYLEPPYIHRIDWFEVTFIVENPATYVPGSTVGTAFVYKDCNGAPGDPVFGYESGFPLIFPHDALVETLPDGSEVYRLIALTDNLFLDGGKAYWVSFQPTGATGQNSADIWYWGSSGSPDGTSPPPYMLGSPPKKMDGLGGPWQVICHDPTDACGGCTDLNFCIRGERCRLIYDAGDPRTFIGAPPAITSLGARSIDANNVPAQQARAADDFTISPCEAELYPCLIEAYIWTNCVPPQAKLELYETQCETADNFARPQDTALIASFSTASGDAVVDTGFSLPGPSGTTFRLYCFRFTNFGGFAFEPGRTYWLSAVATGSATLTNDGYFAFREPRCPDDECYRTGNPGFARSAFAGTPLIYQNWLSTGLLPIAGAQEEDFAFRVAVRYGPPTLNSGATPACIADFDRSGQITVTDIFSFLSEWFSGCP